MTEDGPTPGHRSSIRSCQAVRESLLEVDLERLDDGAGELTAHLACCPGCRRAAARIRSGYVLLDDWLGAPGQAPDVDGILAAARRAEEEPDGAVPTAALRWLVPLALAAAVTALLLRVGGPPPPTGSPPGGNLVATADGVPPPPDLDLAIPPETDAAVFATADPDITVVWFLGGDR